MQFQRLIVMREKPFLPCKSLNGLDEAFRGEALLQDGSIDWSAPGAFCRHLITRESCLQGAGYSQAFRSLLGLTSEIGRRSSAIHIQRQTEFVSHASKCHFPSCTELSVSEAQPLQSQAGKGSVVFIWVVGFRAQGFGGCVLHVCLCQLTNLDWMFVS